MAWVRFAATRILAYAALAYLSAGMTFYFCQTKLLFPAPKTFANTTPSDDGIRFEDLRIAVSAGDHLHAWWIPAADATDKALLVFHGNGYVLEDMVGGEIASLRQTGANLLLVDYRGYGSSAAISPNEKTIDEDGEASLNYLVRDRMIPAGKISVLGRSIGSGPATYLALNNPGLGGLILESPFSSIDDAAVGFWYFRIYPTSLILRSHFDNLRKIDAVRNPVLIVSGTADTLTPQWMAAKLFAQAHQPKQLYSVPGAGHNDLVMAGGAPLEQTLRRFLQEERTK
jgi:fermentation-respiration switch protein FrsA (DUF1100 family)